MTGCGTRPEEGDGAAPADLRCSPGLTGIKGEFMVKMGEWADLGVKATAG